MLGGTEVAWIELGGSGGGALGPHTFLARAMMTNPKEDRLVLMDCVSRSRFPWD